MAVDGSTPFAGGTSAVYDVTPDPQLPHVMIEASFIGKEKAIIGTSEDWNAASKENFYHWAPIRSEGSVQIVPFDDVPSHSGNTIRVIDEDSTIWSEDGSVMTFVAETQQAADVFVIRMNETPVAARNISRWSERKNIRDAGEALDGTAGFLAVSPNGTRVAYCVTASNREDVWIADADGSTAGQNLHVTIDTKFTHPSMNDARDLQWMNEDDLVFYFGDDTNPFDMDLFRYQASTQAVSNLTVSNADGVDESQPPFTRVGTIHPRGHFVGPSGRYLFFFRDGAPPSQGADAVNLIGVDSHTWQVFDLTGNEFSDGWVPSIKGTDSSPAGSEFFVRSSGCDNSFYWFRTALAGESFDHQIFGFDADFPFAAFPLTRFSGAGAWRINDLVPGGFGPVAVAAAGTSVSAEDIYIVDLLHARLTNLTATGNAITHSSDGIRFAEPRGDNPAGVIYAYGTGPSERPNVGVRVDFFRVDESGTLPTSITGVPYDEFFHVLSAIGVDG